ncbi:hypothetical protein F441_22076 [Phytophthora nicotianae CJ01A1]|uniref:Uncharacterized protein n=2 Tax=Phytophthora nicotianae TaxID=4792 RepID=W2FKG9_PHYNI|nr:hypothetical protein L915_21572 [Phytophthora nicotianae]ETL24583.1 hypothetical protein L916_21438 [Phytophthora nicotianae]ETP00527.1 hypothetical protein F441_22076 [Phytophthora nicotianae CJ01A1]
MRFDRFSSSRTPRKPKKKKKNKLQAAMCIKVECPTCHKATWKGCGQHIDAALVGVKEEERCPNWKTGKHEST